MNRTMILRPRISEKAYGLSRERNTYIFDVPTTANRLSVADAVAGQFEVTVETVRISNIKGKVKKSYRKRSSPAVGKRADVKRAYVRLAKGDKLPIFAQEEEEEVKAAKAEEKAEKKAAKEAKKDKK